MSHWHTILNTLWHKLQNSQQLPQLLIPGTRHLTLLEQLPPLLAKQAAFTTSTVPTTTTAPVSAATLTGMASAAAPETASASACMAQGLSAETRAEIQSYCDQWLKERQDNLTAQLTAILRQGSDSITAAAPDIMLSENETAALAAEIAALVFDGTGQLGPSARINKMLLSAPCSVLEPLAQLVSLNFAPQQMSLCSITNVKSGRCSENCAWCAQSRHHQTTVATYDLKSAADCIAEARNSFNHGVEMFSLVASGRKPNAREFAALLQLIDQIKAAVPIKLCVSLGLVSKEQLKTLKEHGIERYHCNLETAASYFPQVCTTHSFQDKLRVLQDAADIGLEVCSGVLFNMGESSEQRLEIASSLRSLKLKSIPLNILHPINGTPLAARAQLSRDEFIRSCIILRLLNPYAFLRFAGGRALLPDEWISAALRLGINAAITGDLLTTTGGTFTSDRTLFNQYYELPPLPETLDITSTRIPAIPG